MLRRVELVSKHTINLCFDTNLPTGGCELLDFISNTLCQQLLIETNQSYSKSLSRRVELVPKHTINWCFDTNLSTDGCELLHLFQILCCCWRKRSIKVRLSKQKTWTVCVKLCTFPLWLYNQKKLVVEVLRNFLKIGISKVSKQCSSFQDPMSCFCFSISRSNKKSLLPWNPLTTFHWNARNYREERRGNYCRLGGKVWVWYHDTLSNQ